MQDRYAGDIGDYGKLGLLCKLSEKFSIGINWYNSGKPEFEQDKYGKFKQEDGKYRSYKGVENYAPDIISKLESLKNAPSIKKLEKLDLISNAVYYNKIVPKENERREKWHKGALKKLGKCDIVFLDPDNGLLCNSVKMGVPKSVKYTYYSEVRDYLVQNQTVIIYNHRSRKKEELYFNEIIVKLCENSEVKCDLTQVVTFRKYSVRDYFIISNDKYSHETIKSLIESLPNNNVYNKPFFIHKEISKNKAAVVTDGANSIGK